ncbi:MAG: hypothetical protein M9885_01415 [Burkholderiaceae bacterium]|nr:hypothetical protein [Burkholderiaceae bacterium]
MKPGRRLESFAAEVARLRREVAADAQIRASVAAVKQWQAQRLARTHRRLLGDPRYAAAARFFLDDLYGAKDFSRRDAELARIVPMMVRLLPEAALETIAEAVEMDSLSERLDLALARELAEDDVSRIDAARYADAYRRAGSRTDRERQLALIEGVGHSLDRLVRHPMVGRLLRSMARPAQLAGVAGMQDFLVRGFEAFRAIGGAYGFVEAIGSRERTILEALYAGATEGWDRPEGP